MSDSNPFREGFFDSVGNLVLPEPPPWRNRRPKETFAAESWARDTWPKLLPGQAPQPGDEIEVAMADLASRAARHSFRDLKWELDVIRAAITLRRPILVTGKPGVGKSSLAYVTAHHLGLGPVLRWSVGSKSTVEAAVYQYDAVRRLEYYAPGRPRNQTAALTPAQEEGQFYRLGPLGTALLPRLKPRVLLIDEIDKSDLDLPDDLLHVLEEGNYEIPELARLNLDQPVPVRTADGDTAKILGGRLQCFEFPLIFLTSNGERDFSSAFLRRCLQLSVSRPTKEELEQIVRKQMDHWLAKNGRTLNPALLEEMATDFFKRMEEEEVTTDQLLNTFFIRSEHGFGPDIKLSTAKNTADQPRPES